MAKGVNDKLDLVLERVIKAPRALVWQCWTTPEHLKQWFTPKPVETTHCEIDLRPGGRFNTTMRMPDGAEHASEGSYLDVVEGARLVFTDALREGWRPNAAPFMTAVLRFEDHPEGTQYVAHVLHHDEAGKKRHEEMGFFDGWGTATTQLETYARTMEG